MFTGGAARYCPVVLTNLFGCYQRQLLIYTTISWKSQALIWDYAITTAVRVPNLYLRIRVNRRLVVCWRWLVVLIQTIAESQPSANNSRRYPPRSSMMVVMRWRVMMMPWRWAMMVWRRSAMTLMVTMSILRIRRSCAKE